MYQLVERKWSVQMPVHHFGCGAAERHLTREHIPESHAQGINIRTNIYLAPRTLLWTGKYGSSGEGARHGKGWIRLRNGGRSCQPEINDFDSDAVVLLEAEHNISRLDVPMYDL